MYKKDTKMDSRCPRSLEALPNQYCPLAVMRLRAIRTADHELSEVEEANLPGCPWAVNHQMSNYCFFKYIQEYSSDKPPSDIEVASLNCISVETVKKTEKSALTKIRETEEFKDLKESMEGESVVNEHNPDDTHKINR